MTYEVSNVVAAAVIRNTPTRMRTFNSIIMMLYWGKLIKKEMGCLDCIKVFYWMNLKNYNSLIKYIPNSVLKCQMLQKDNRVIIFFVCLLCMIYQISYLIVVGNWMNHSSKRPTTYSIFYVCFFLIRHLLVDIYLINVTWFFRSILYIHCSQKYICLYFWGK